MGRRVEVESVANRVRARRLAAGMHQQELADACGVTRQAIGAIEAGHYVPNTAVSLRMAQVLGCSVEALFSLPEAPVRVEAELLRGHASPDPSDARVHVARIGGRVLALPLRGDLATATAADGLTRAWTSDGAGKHTASVELLVELERIERAVVVRGCDPALALLGAHLARRQPAFRLVWIHEGSLGAIRALGRGEAHAAGSHLRDPDTGDSNVPYVARELPGYRVLVITLSEWQQGLIVAGGNPKGIRGPGDLARQDVAIVNREPGSGSRLLLDDSLARCGIAPASVRGYGREAATHLGVAETIAAGAADAGPGILAVARALGLDFIPVQEERYDLVIPTEHLGHEPLQALIDVAMSPVYRRELEALGGYDSSHAGDVVAELAS